jgi:hypothetical protein
VLKRISDLRKEFRIGRRVLSAVELCKGGREEMTIQFSSGRQAGRQF